MQTEPGIDNLLTSSDQKLNAILKLFKWTTNDLHHHQLVGEGTSTTPCKTKPLQGSMTNPSSRYFYERANAVVCLEAPPKEILALYDKTTTTTEPLATPVNMYGYYDGQVPPVQQVPIQRIDQLQDAYVEDNFSPNYVEENINSRTPSFQYGEQEISQETQARLAEYLYLVEQAKIFRSQRSVQTIQLEVNLNLNGNNNSNREKSKWEILAEQRDYKRRRQSYRAKNVHITKRTPVQVTRDLIELLLQQYQPQKDEKQEKAQPDNTPGTSARYQPKDLQSHERDRDKQYLHHRERGRDSDRSKHRERSRERERSRDSKEKYRDKRDSDSKRSRKRSHSRDRSSRDKHREHKRKRKS